jgi:hypothetical protein
MRFLSIVLLCCFFYLYMLVCILIRIMLFDCVLILHYSNGYFRSSSVSISISYSVSISVLLWCFILLFSLFLYIYRSKNFSFGNLGSNSYIEMLVARLHFSTWRSAENAKWSPVNCRGEPVYPLLSSLGIQSSAL